MNARRVAKLLRQLADELERDDAPANDGEVKPAPPRKTKDEIQAIVKRKLARRGIRGGDPFT